MESSSSAQAAPSVPPVALIIRQDWLYNGLAKLDASSQQLPADATDHAIVYDPITGLMEAIRAEGFDKDLSHDDAMQAAEALRHAGYGDWQLPDVQEAMHSVDYTFMDPAADPSLYPDAAAVWYWTRQQTKWTEGKAGSSRSFFYVAMYSGGVSYDFASLRQRVRPVRRAVPASQCLALGQS